MSNGIAQNHLAQYCRLKTHLQSPRTSADSDSVAPADLLWECPPEALTLAGGEIHVWRARLDDDVGDLEPFSAILSEEESVRAARYLFEKDRKRFILRRSLLREILSRYLNTEPARLRFAYGPHGKPALAFPCQDDFQFNLSHSEGLAVYAVTRVGAVGVDIERVRVIREAEQIAARYFSPQETAGWLSSPSDRLAESFLRYWSRKEARLKVNGRGIFDLEERSRGPEAAERDEPSSKPRCSVPHSEGVLYELTPATDYIGALALAVPGVVRD